MALGIKSLIFTKASSDDGTIGVGFGVGTGVCFSVGDSVKVGSGVLKCI